MILAITPVPAFPAQAVSLQIDDVRVVLDQSADCQWQLLDADGKQVSLAARCALTPEQYAKWGNDDQYFATCIAENLGLEIV